MLLLKSRQIIHILIDNNIQIRRLIMRRNVSSAECFRHLACAIDTALAILSQSLSINAVLKKQKQVYSEWRRNGRKVVGRREEGGF
jgi:hypothetical protein